ncbi:hypothetical protein ACFE04_024998 [Oxalis oulophora]
MLLLLLRGNRSPALKKVKHYSVQRVIGDGRCIFRALVKGMGINLKSRAERDDADVLCDNDKEFTQGIGAYKVLVPVDGKLQPCVFLDTPEHEAFGAMRARGAKVTDIAVIVVAADDGIRPQTNEAIAHAKAAGVPIVIAINKIDKDGANPDRLMQELSSIGLVPEDWGGDIPMVQISALRWTNVDDLLEIIMLVAEELKANPNRNAKGTVIEAGLQKSRGPVATFIVQNGTLKKGDIVVSGEAYGKPRLPSAQPLSRPAVYCPVTKSLLLSRSLLSNVHCPATIGPAQALSPVQQSQLSSHDHQLLRPVPSSSPRSPATTTTLAVSIFSPLSFPTRTVICPRRVHPFQFLPQSMLSQSQLNL